MKKSSGINKKMILVLLLLLGISTAAFAAAGSTALSDVGSGAKTEIQGFLKSLTWLLSIAGVAVPLATAGWAWNKISEKEEADQGQKEPKLMKVFKIIAALFSGFAAMYLFYGTLAVTLLGKSFSAGWGIFVTGFFASIFP